MADLRKEFANDLPELFLRNLLLDVFVGAVEVRGVSAEAVGAEQRTDQDDPGVIEAGVGADVFGHFDAEPAFEIDVHDDKVGMGAADEVEGRLAGFERRYVEAKAAKVLDQKRPEGTRFIGDDGDTPGRCPGRRLRRPLRGPCVRS